MVNSIRTESRNRLRLELEVNDLTGGFVSKVASYNIDNRFLADIQNMELVQGMWQKRKGFHLSGSFGGVSTSKEENKGMHVFNLQGNLHILAVYGTTLYDTYQLTKDTGTKIISNTLPDVKKIRFRDFRNNCYLAHGNGGILKYDGNQLRDIDSPPGSIITSFDERLILADIKGDPLILYYSNRGRGDVWNPLNYVLVDGGSNEKITGLTALQGKLYIFTNKSIYSLIGSFDSGIAITKEVEGAGPASPEAVQIFGNNFYFITDTGEIYEYDGGSFPKEISINIKTYLQNNFSSNHFKKCATTYYKNSVWFTLNNHPSPSERITLVYYPDYMAWSKFVGIPASSYIYVDNQLYFTGSHNRGSIYQYGTQYKDDTTAIDAYIKTVRWDFDRLENLKRFKEIYIRGTVQGGLGNGFDITFYIDKIAKAPIHVTANMASLNQLWNKEILDPILPPSLTTKTSVTSTLAAGDYQVAYSWVNQQGETRISPASTITIADGEAIEVDVPVFPDEVFQVNVFMSVEVNSSVLALVKTSQDNINIELISLPAIDAAFPLTESTINNEKNRWGNMYWGFAADSSGSTWGSSKWGYFKWNSSEITLSPKWGFSVWNAFEWGANTESNLIDDVGKVEAKLYLSQYNIISGKTLEIEFRDNTPGHGFRFENLTLVYIQKGAR